MPNITRFPVLSHLRAGPNEFILQFAGGKVVRSGAGMAFWFRPLNSSIAMVPVEDRETTFVLRERTSDMQEVAAQCTLTFRISDPARAATRFNFTISLATGAWLEKPLERLESAWALRTRDPARAYLSGVVLTEAVSRGPIAIRERLLAALAADEEVAGMGLSLVNVVVDALSPPPEVQKALETPTREAIQQRADTAVFERRALAVEKERAIKENELATQIELARRQEELIRRQGANRLQEIQSVGEAEKAKVIAESERGQLAADAYAASTRTKAAGDAEARQLLGAADVRGEEQRLAVYAAVSPEVLRALALRDLAANLPDIQHLNITPELLGEGLTRLLRKQAEE